MDIVARLNGLTIYEVLSLIPGGWQKDTKTGHSTSTIPRQSPSTKMEGLTGTFLPSEIHISP